MKTNDSLIREVRDRAMKISERHGHDLHQYCEHLRQKQIKHPERIVSQITVVTATPKRRRAR